MWNQEKAKNFMEQARQYGSVLGLDNMKHLMAELGDVQDKLNIIHVAGTNGKGSVCAMLSSILTRAGYKTGTYTSPWVVEYEEIWQIDGELIGKDAWLCALEQVKEACLRLTKQGLPHPTAFEIETALAFYWFEQEACEIVILETGLGGSKDATNIIKKPLCSVITSISRDHMEFLGNGLSEIAKAKAGIIKEGRPTVAVKPVPEVLSELGRACKEKKSELILVDPKEAQEIHYEENYLVFRRESQQELRLSLQGLYQVENALLALKAIECVKHQAWKIGDEAIREGLANARWPGRFEIVRQNPLVILDGAHNEAAARKLRESLEFTFPNRKMFVIVGVLADKEYEKMLAILLPLASKVYTVTPEHPRALHGEHLHQTAKRYHDDVIYSSDNKEAFRLALTEAGKEAQALVLIFGSLSCLKSIKNGETDEDWNTRL